jgi:hypothetical protein
MRLAAREGQPARCRLRLGGQNGTALAVSGEGGEMLPKMVMVLLALCLLGTARPAADGGFIPLLSLLAAATVAIHLSRVVRAFPALAAAGR